MGKLSNVVHNAPTPPVGPLTTANTATAVTHQGGAGFVYGIKTELFLLATTNFVGEDTFYEDARGRDTRYRDLVAKNALADPAWTAQFLAWLRNEANMRSASILGAVEAAKVLSGLQAAGLKAKGAETVTARQVLKSVLVRADEPAEALGYWLGTYGRPVPKWLKRGIGDAILRLYTPFNVLKWDSQYNPIRMADVVEFSQIKRHMTSSQYVAGGNHHAVFKYLIDARHGRGDASEIPMLAARNAFNELPKEERRAALQHPSFPEVLKAAGLTWEAVSGWLSDGKGMDTEAWQTCIPLMRYGALIKNLANFERVQISKASRDAVIATLTDPEQVKRSRLLPMAFLNAYNNVPGDTFKAALDEAATYALINIPYFAGRTLILIDTSGSMDAPFVARKAQNPAWLKSRHRDDKPQLMRWETAALFGIALAKRCANADIVSFSAAGRTTYQNYATTRYTYWPPGQTSPERRADGFKVFDLIDGENLLRSVSRFKQSHFIGGGTDTAGAVQRYYHDHDRVVVLTDEQANQSPHGVFATVPLDKPTYTFNLAGYAQGHAHTSATRHLVGGLSDAGFKLMDAIEQNRRGRWPWESDEE